MDSKDLIYEDWGLIPYEEALNKQLSLIEKVYTTGVPGFLIFCSHPAVVTTGRATQPSDIFAWQGPVIEIARGGRATYHGPSQLVVYPIINLNFPRRGRGVHEVQGYLRTFETAICKILSDFGITAIGKSVKNSLERDASQLDQQSKTKEPELTGVWVDGKKVASLGIGVRNWIGYHGAAINLQSDPQAFQGIHPCGFSSEIMTDVETLLGSPIDRKLFSEKLKAELLKVL